MIGGAAHEFHHVGGVAQAETERLDEEGALVVGAAGVEHHVRELGRARAVGPPVGQAVDVGGDEDRLALGRAQREAVAAAVVARQRGGRLHARPMGLRLGVQAVDRGVVGGGEMHAQERRLRALA